MASSGVPNFNSNSNGIDASVGALVWVRRRNGTWWPGQIMGLDEFTSDSLVSPAAGTPVKLLGREDPSVDWYNLEKSKRVKAFRCGEYDEFIEKAKASAANGNRKKVRYATREDAILHALEIEKAHTSKISVDLSRQDDFGVEHGVAVKETFRLPISGKEDLVITNGKQNSGGCRDDSDLVSAPGSVANSDFDAEYTASQLSEFGVSFEVPMDSFKVPSVDGKSRRTPNDSEDDGTGGIKRMRGLGDLGIGVRDPKTVTCISNGTLANGSKVCTSSLKRKRTQVGHVPELLRRKNRRRQLTKVLESTAMVSVPLFSDQLSTYQATSESKFSGVDSNESRKGSSGVINNNSDSTGVSCENGSSVNITEHAFNAPHANDQASKENDDSHGLGPADNDSSEKLFDVPFVEEETNLADSSSLPELASEMHYQAGIMRRQFTRAEVAPEALQESGAVISAKDYDNGTCQRTEKDTSKWQSKGKRNLRRKGKSKRRDMRKYTDLNSKSLTRLENKGHFNGLPSSSSQNVDSDGVGHDASCGRNLQVNSRMFSRDLADGVRDYRGSLPHPESHIGGLGGQVSPASQSQRSLPYRQSRSTINSRYQSSYFLGRSSSIRSKLHDVKLEVNADCEPSHVPLLSLVSNLNSKAIIGHPLTVAVLDDGYCDHLICQNKSDAMQVTAQKTANWQASAARNSEAGRGQGSSKSKKVQSHCSRSKSSKHRKNGLSSKKTRKLSSLNVNRECHRKTVAEKPNGSVIACIPLKLVFSRINEALNRSARQPHPPSASANSINRLLGT